MEFHISRSARERYNVQDALFSYTGSVVFADVSASRLLAQRINEVRGAAVDPKRSVHGAALFAMGLIDELSHAMIARFRQTRDPKVFGEALAWFDREAEEGTASPTEALLLAFSNMFPNTAVFRGDLTAEQWLSRTTEGVPHREAAFEELMMLWLSNINPAFRAVKELVDDTPLVEGTSYPNVVAGLPAFFATRPQFSPEAGSLLEALMAPMLASPDSLAGQVAYIRERWAPYLGEHLRTILLAMDVLKEEEIAIWRLFHPGDGGTGRRGGRWGPGGWRDEGFEGDEYVGFEELTRRRAAQQQQQQPALNEYEAFSQDQAWMPNVVLIAKSTYVWLEQLSKKYGRHIFRLDQIPHEELRLLADRGLNGLWLIGLWERSTASQTIKRLRGQDDAVASAYSLKDYRIADDLGGNEAYERLRDRAASAGLRLASDMVPNHMGIDSNWVMEHPDWFISRHESPFPSYSFEGPDLSVDSRYEIKIEDHYYDQTDAAVAFRLRARDSGHTQYLYHGNDGTTFAWNDTAQLDYSKAYVREQVIQAILHVARLFPIIRFDAAMVLAKKHVQRLWFPLPGMGGSIPSRAEDAMSQEEFDALMPHEFWREVVDRVAVEVPGTLLLAEAFWLLEGYFVRTLGMHRVYNSAFMNMLRDEENAKYRSYLKKTIEFDPEILKRYVNFMSNPDERTAIDQFGTGDKYFGTSVLLATLPGLPMFGHGQIEAFTEKYGMEYKRARFDESPNEELVARHQREIAPLLKRRHVFAESADFVLYDFWTADGAVDENVFAYSNRSGDERSLILFNNAYGSTHGTIHTSTASMDKGSGELRQRSLVDGLGLGVEDSVLVAFRDQTTHLEYLHRSTALAQEGLTVPLRGYQYAVLLHWRPLRATAEQPWDQLCDALAGAGVHSLDEALSKLRLRPLHEALRHALAPDGLEQLVALSHLPEAEAVAAGVEGAPARSAGAARGAAVLATAAAAHPAVVEMTSRATNFLRLAGEFRGEAPAETPVQGSADAGAFAEAVVAAIEIPRARRRLAARAGPHASRDVLPSDSASDRAIGLWAPVVSWAMLRSAAPKAEPVAVFDELQLRSALAEIFSSLGLEGESAWRAAARVRVLLLAPDATALEPRVTDAAFWSDPDVRWLAGVSEAHETLYLNKERFEELLWWMQLPALLDAGGDPRAASARLTQLESETIHLAERAAAVGYQVRKLIATGASQTSARTEPVHAPAFAIDAVMKRVIAPAATPSRTKSKTNAERSVTPTAASAKSQVPASKGASGKRPVTAPKGAAAKSTVAAKTSSVKPVKEAKAKPAAPARTPSTATGAAPASQAQIESIVTRPASSSGVTAANAAKSASKGAGAGKTSRKKS